MVGKTIPEGKFTVFTAKGNLAKGAVVSEWLKIWNMKLERKYTADFEVYGAKAQNPEDAEVDIFVATKLETGGAGTVRPLLLLSRF